ncbi:MAG: methyltransferase type 12 [Magnetovibrio sp.]|nr:methyltransferase type 12 [Magnetovibrio sp.]|tara:strand:- start:162 stop:1142 length:981 start_codon:yes stop_codon:yes gene_type:complete
MSEKNKNYRCAICGAFGGQGYQFLELAYGTKEPFDFFQCRNCECLQIIKIPENISDHYPKDFYSYTQKKRKTNNFVKRFFRRSRTRYALEGKGFIGSILHRIKRPSVMLDFYADLGIKISDTILDVGGGTGDFAWQMRSFGIRDILAIDKFIEADVFVDGKILAKKTDIFSIERQYDLITFHHSLEHMQEQQKTLLHAKKLLKKNGRILVRIPTVTSDNWEKYGVNWMALEVPRHFYIHSHKSIRLLAKQVDLKVTRLWSDSTIVPIWVSEQYLKGISMFAENSYGENPEKSIFNDAQIEEFQKIADDNNKRNRGDTICVLLEQIN